MKKILLTLHLLFSLTTISAQNAIAIIKYEEAEIAFDKNDYSTSLSKLDEAEKSLGSTNSKILYLRILNQNQIITSDPMGDFKILDAARKNCTNYLKNNESKTGLEEKYKEVYKIKQDLEKYPNTASELIIKKEKEKNDKFQIEELTRINIAKKESETKQKFDSFQVVFKDFLIGTTTSELDRLIKKNRSQVHLFGPIESIVNAIIKEHVNGKIYLSGGEFVGGFIYSNNEKKIAGVFNCPIYTQNEKRFDVEFERQKMSLIQHFGKDNIWEGELFTDKNDLIKVVKIIDDKNGLICIVSPPRSYYSWMFVFKLDYNLLQN